jgi:methylaspartate ammonia-lyase
MASILFRFADFLDLIPDSVDTVLKYPDAGSISDYAKTAALYCQTMGIIGGRSGGVFTPKETATRAEVAAIIQRFIEVVLG